jgi:hypothetical protein
MRAPIRLKLLAAFGLNLVLMLALGVFTIAQMASISAPATSVAENSVVSLAIVNQITLAITEYRSLQAEHIAQSDAAAMTTIEQEMQALA